MTDNIAVDAEIIHTVAKKYGMGAGALKGLLKSTNLESYDENSREMKAVTEAYSKQRKQNQENQD
jgi:hypothetical protein